MYLVIVLKYEEGGNMEVLKVVVKGVDYVVIRLKGIVKENDVFIIENKLLVRMMYERVEIDEDIL